MVTRFLLAMALALSALCAHAQFAQAKAQLILGAKSAPAGSVIKGTLKVTIPDGYHAYQNPPSKDYMIPLKATMLTKDCILKEVVYPAGKDVTVTGETGSIRVYEGTVEIPVTITVPKKAGSLTIKINVSYQLCVDAECYPPDDVVALAKINVTAVKK